MPLAPPLPQPHSYPSLSLKEYASESIQFSTSISISVSLSSSPSAISSSPI